MYSIATIIYGIPLTEEISKLIGEWELEMSHEKWQEDDQGRLCGFETMYSGSANHIPGFCGVALDQFDECKDVKLSNLNTTPSKNQIGKTMQRIAKLEPEIRDIMPEVDVYIVWSTS